MGLGNGLTIIFMGLFEVCASAQPSLSGDVDLIYRMNIIALYDGTYRPSSSLRALRSTPLPKSKRPTRLSHHCELRAAAPSCVFILVRHLAAPR